MLGMSKKGMYETGKVLFLPVEAIVPNPDQPRKRFSQGELEELAASIRALGVLQPLTVRRREGKWELVAGERRLRAARLAGLQQVPCLAIQADSQSSSLLALVENVQRRDLDFWEEALALRRLTDAYALSQEEVARRMGRSQSAVEKYRTSGCRLVGCISYLMESKTSSNPGTDRAHLVILAISAAVV